MSELELRASAALDEIALQRMLLGDRAAKLASELAVARARIAQLESEVEKLKPKPEAPQEEE